jgi:hypothetical protein
MAVIKSEVQPSAVVSGTPSSLSTLASGTYFASGAINHSINDPLDVLIDVSVTSGTAVTSPSFLAVFCQASPDGVNFTSGPTTGTDATNEFNLYLVGTIPMNAVNTAYRKIFSLATAYGGTLPLYSRLVFKNSTGAALTGTAAVTASEVWGVAF